MCVREENILVKITEKANETPDTTRRTSNQWFSLWLLREWTPISFQYISVLLDAVCIRFNREFSIDYWKHNSYQKCIM